MAVTMLLRGVLGRTKENWGLGFRVWIARLPTSLNQAPVKPHQESDKCVRKLQKVSSASHWSQVGLDVGLGL